MRAIIIEEERFAEVCDLMELNALNLKNSGTATLMKIPQNVWEAAINEVHRSMHFHFVRWAQSHGASCVKK